MLVVIAIIGVLVALLLPAVQAAREAARRCSCQNNLKQLGLAFHSHAGTGQGFPALSMHEDPAWSSRSPPRSWVVDVLPFLEQGPICKAYRLSEPYDSTTNRAVVANVIRVLQCPSSPELGRTTQLYSAAGASLGSRVIGGAIDYFPHFAISSEDLLSGKARNPALSWDKEQPLAAFGDGLSQTILLDEVSMRPTQYINGYKQTTTVTAPQWAAWGGFAETNLYMYNADGTYSTTPLTAPCGINCNNDAGIYAFHPSGANSLFCDGSVHFLSTKTAASIVIGLATRDGDEILAEGSY
jgi:prepilin-type processing-associated H-X9-DG protein